jgi:CheY-like chemotaxis protein
MALRVHFKDRHSLWAGLIKADTARFFIATDEVHAIGAQVPVEVAMGAAPGPTLPILLSGVVIGLRGRSNRFLSGVFVRFDDKEMEKCRRFVGLSQSFAPELCRAAVRVDCTLAVRFVSPDDPASYQAKNLSEDGLQCTCPKGLFESERVQLVLALDDGQAIELQAEVSWAQDEHQVAGFRFLEVSQDARRRLALCLQRFEQSRKAAEAALHRLVVVADDEPSVVELLTRVLTKHGFNVAAAKRGDEALELIRKVKPRLVILDVLMPGIDGVDICKMLRADASMADVPVVFLSALDQETLDRVAGDAGATDYLHKPIALTDLLNMVGTYLKS